MAAMERQCWLCLAHIPTNKPSISSSSSSSTLSSMSTSSSTSSSSCASPSISSGPSYFSLDRPLIDQDSVYAQATSATASSSQAVSCSSCRTGEKMFCCQEHLQLHR